MDIRTKTKVTAEARRAALKKLRDAHAEIDTALDALEADEMGQVSPDKVSQVKSAAERFVAVRRSLRMAGMEVVFDA